MSNDKSIERERYELRAHQQLSGIAMIDDALLGSQTMPPYLQTPYILYEKIIIKSLQAGQCVLELGAGSGLHTLALLQTGAKVTASDISAKSLTLLKQRLQNAFCNLETKVADMESLPFDDSSFDVIACAGSLSYGEPDIVDAEIRRVLRPGGLLICVDSLNHNPVYRANRWLHYLRGIRSRSTLNRMPDLPRIKALGSGFSNVSVQYFGALSFAMPVFALFFGHSNAKKASDWIDQFIGVKHSAFKFVFVAQGKLK